MPQVWPKKATEKIKKPWEKGESRSPYKTTILCIGTSRRLSAALPHSEPHPRVGAGLGALRDGAGQGERQRDLWSGPHVVPRPPRDSALWVQRGATLDMFSEAPRSWPASSAHPCDLTPWLRCPTPAPAACALPSESEDRRGLARTTRPRCCPEPSPRGPHAVPTLPQPHGHTPHGPSNTPVSSNTSGVPSLTAFPYSSKTQSRCCRLQEDLLASDPGSGAFPELPWSLHSLVETLVPGTVTQAPGSPAPPGRRVASAPSRIARW